MESERSRGAKEGVGMILIMDHHDTFTYSLAQIFGERDNDILVKKSSELTLEDIDNMKPDYLILSSGGGSPEAAGITLEAARTFAGRIPILGVGLGHHAIAEAFGARIYRTGEVVHGKPADVFHDGKTIYTGLGDPFATTVYHPFFVDRDSIPEDLEVSAQDSSGTVMGIRHRELAVEGVQFNPESIMTPAGDKILHRFIEYYQQVKG